MTNVTIGNSVNNIGEQAFRFCTSLTSVVLPNNLTNIGSYAFQNCTSLTSVIIPNSVTSIGHYAFQYCTSLTSVTLPSSLISIGYQAFSDCRSLTSVTIPSSVTSIGSEAFSHCTSLSAITVDALNSFYSGVDGVLFNESQTTLIQCPARKAGSYTIPNSVTSIGNYAFADCWDLQSVTIGNNVTSIGEGGFYNCISLASTTLPNSVINIGYYAFSDCRSLSNVTIGNSVTSIGEWAFQYCTSLTRITIPKSVTNIGYYAFQYCPSLTAFYFKGNAIPGGGIGSPALSGAIGAVVYYLPGTIGWGPTFRHLPTMLWNPQVQTTDASFGVRTNRFGFTITGTTNIPIVVEACSNLATPAWVTLDDCTLTNGSFYFSDPQWTNYPRRFYRIRSP